jgi:type VI protein secretion system component Hcp
MAEKLHIDAFLKLMVSGSPIKGECTDEIFKGLIELDSFSMDAEKDAKGRLEGEDKVPPVARKHTNTPEVSLGPLQDTDDATPDRSVGKDAFSFKITKDMDISSRFLLQNYCFTWRGDSKPFDTAEIYFRKGGWNDAPGATGDSVSFLVLKFTKPYVFEYSLDVGDTSIPSEEVKFYFENYTMQYSRQLETGDIGTGEGNQLELGWDFNENKEK